MCVNKPASVTSVNELTLSSAGEVQRTVECPPDVPPDVSPVNELSLSSAGEVPRTVECPPDVSPVNELTLSSASEVPHTSTLTCSMFYNKRRDIEKVKTYSCVKKANSRRSERKTCRPQRYQ